MSQHPFTTPSVIYLGQGHTDAGSAGAPAKAQGSVSAPGR
jgi:hypothetical protein